MTSTPVNDGPRPATGGVVLCAALALAASPPPAAAQALTPGERRVTDGVDARRDEAVALLERAVGIKSGTRNLVGVRAVGALFGGELARLGFDVRWEAMPASMGRAGHLVAEREGTRGKRLLLLGHLDTVLEGRPFARHGARATGPGVVDMKGGNVVILHALQALHRAGALDDRRVVVLLTGDEEDTGMPLSRSRGVLVDAAKRSDVALSFEAMIDGGVTVARRGNLSWTLRVSGPSGHSSRVSTPGVGGGAVLETARVLDGFRRALKGERGVSFNASLVLGGAAVDHDPAASRGTAAGVRNVVPRAAVAEGDLRYLSARQRDDCEAAMRAVVADHPPEAAVALEFAAEYPAMPPTPGNRDVLRAFDAASRDLGLGPVTALDPCQRGAGDVSFAAPFVAALDGLGPVGGDEHLPTEWVDLDSLPVQIKRASLLIYRLTRD